MKLWEKAKEKYPALSRMDFIQQTCPHKLNLAEKPPDCENPDKITGKCKRCWDREVEE